MTFTVTAGKEELDAVTARGLAELAALCAGLATKTIYLNGGSSTRRDTREFWQAFAERNGIPIEVQGGCMIRLGGRGGL